MVKLKGNNGNSLRAVARQLFAALPGWLRVPLIGKARRPQDSASPDRLEQRDIYKVFYLLLKQAGGKISMFQETIDNVDADFVKDFVFCKEPSLNGLGPGWVISLRSSEADRKANIHKRARRRSTKRLDRRKSKTTPNITHKQWQQNKDIKAAPDATAESEAAIEAAKAVENMKLDGLPVDGPD